MNLLTIFKEGGWAMYPTMFLGMASFAVSTVHAVVKLTATRLVGAGFMALTIACGLYGTSTGRHTTESAIANVDPSIRQQILEQGYMESARPTQMALVFVVVAVLPFLVGEIRTWASRAKA